MYIYNQFIICYALHGWLTNYKQIRMALMLFCAYKVLKIEFCKNIFGLDVFNNKEINVIRINM